MARFELASSPHPKCGGVTGLPNIPIVQNTFFLTVLIHNSKVRKGLLYVFLLLVKTQNQFHLNRVCDKHSQGRERILALYYCLY